MKTIQELTQKGIYKILIYFDSSGNYPNYARFNNKGEPWITINSFPERKNDADSALNYLVEEYGKKELQYDVVYAALLDKNTDKIIRTLKERTSGTPSLFFAYVNFIPSVQTTRTKNGLPQNLLIFSSDQSAPTTEKKIEYALQSLQVQVNKIAIESVSNVLVFMNDGSRTLLGSLEKGEIKRMRK